MKTTILKEVINQATLDNEKQAEIKQEQEKFLKILQENIKKLKLKADVFIGGSIAKGTIIKQDCYDIDIFVRFKEEKDIASYFERLCKNIIQNNKEYRLEIIHGSRDYCNFYFRDLIFEVVPTRKISNPNQAKNSTDLSYFHVKYVKNKLKNKNLANQIKLAKLFEYASGSYGAESHINGFSGYATEILIIYYKTFENFIKTIAKSKDRIVIDIEKYYKNKQEILNNINESKLQSPIVLVDPTFKFRNITAALSQETFDKFKIYCKKFLKSANKKYFNKQLIEQERLKKLNKKGLIKLIATTSKQQGAIAGSKLLKFFNFITSKIKKYYILLDKEFIYDDKNKATYYFIVKKKDKLILQGPPIKMQNNVKSFKKEHKSTFIKNSIIYAKEKNNKTINNILSDNKEIMKSMGIDSIKA